MNGRGGSMNGRGGHINDRERNTMMDNMGNRNINDENDYDDIMGKHGSGVGRFDVESNIIRPSPNNITVNPNIDLIPGSGGVSSISNKQNTSNDVSRIRETGVQNGNIIGNVSGIPDNIVNSQPQSLFSANIMQSMGQGGRFLDSNGRPVPDKMYQSSIDGSVPRYGNHYRDHDLPVGPNTGRYDPMISIPCDSPLFRSSSSFQVPGVPGAYINALHTFPYPYYAGNPCVINRNFPPG